MTKSESGCERERERERERKKVGRRKKRPKEMEKKDLIENWLNQKINSHSNWNRTRGLLESVAGRATEPRAADDPPSWKSEFYSEASASLGILIMFGTKVEEEED